MKKSLIAILMVAALLLAVLAVPVFADEEDGIMTVTLLGAENESENAEVTDVDGEGTEAVTTSVDDAEEGETTEAEDKAVETVEETEDAQTTGTTDAETETVKETTEETPDETNSDGGDNVVDDPFDLEDHTVLIWNLVIGGIVLAGVIAAIVVFLVLPKRREKTLKFFRGLKSEWKKISWYSWKQTWKGTLVVAIVAIVIAIVVGLLDTGFSQGLNALAKLFKQ